MPIPQDPSSPGLFDYTLSAVDYIDSEIEGVDVVSTLLNQRENADGSVSDVMDVGFKILGVPGTFFVHPGADPVWPDNALNAIFNKVVTVLAIYSGLSTFEEAFLISQGLA